MLPGYTPLFYTVVSHIHLGAVPYDGGSPSGFGSHGEPPYKYSHIDHRWAMPEGQSAFERSWTGVPFDHVLRTSDNLSPITYLNLRYEMRVDHTEFDVLQALYKRRVYLVDNRHCADNLDHTPYVKIKFFEDLTYDDTQDQQLELIVVTATFRDMNTVAGI